MKRIAAALLAAGIYAILAQSVQALDLDKNVREPDQSAESEKAAAETGESAQLLQSVESPARIAYADILKNPDNIELNYNYARQQVREGDLKGASATLERILALKPEMTKVRLVYGVVLYRLDNLIEARRELKAVETALLPENSRNEIKDYLKRIDRRLKRTNVSAMAGAGANYDSNRNASPTSGERLFNGVPVKLTTGLKEDDASTILMARLGIVHDPGMQSGHTVFAEANAYRAEQDKVDVLDLQSYSARAGAVLKTRFGDFAPAGTIGNVILAERTYLKLNGGELRWDYGVTYKTRLFALGQVFNQTYVNTRDIPTATERTGWQSGVQAGVSYVLTPVMRITGGAGYFRNNARKAYNAYDRYEFKGAHAWLLGKGCFAMSSIILDSDKYLKADRAISPKVRRDTGLRASVTLGAPLALIAEPLRSLLLTASLERFKSKSNLTNYTYVDNKAGVMLIYKWDAAL